MRDLEWIKKLPGARHPELRRVESLEARARRLESLRRELDAADAELEADAQEFELGLLSEEISRARQS